MHLKIFAFENIFCLDFLYLTGANELNKKNLFVLSGIIMDTDPDNPPPKPLSMETSPKKPPLTSAATSASPLPSSSSFPLSLLDTYLSSFTVATSTVPSQITSKSSGSSSLGSLTPGASSIDHTPEDAKHAKEQQVEPEPGRLDFELTHWDLHDILMLKSMYSNLFSSLVKLVIIQKCSNRNEICIFCIIPWAGKATHISCKITKCYISKCLLQPSSSTNGPVRLSDTPPSLTMFLSPCDYGIFMSFYHCHMQKVKVKGHIKFGPNLGVSGR